VAYTGGGDARTVGRGQAFALEALTSVDAGAAALLSYSWSCAVEGTVAAVVAGAGRVWHVDAAALAADTAYACVVEVQLRRPATPACDPAACGPAAAAPGALVPYGCAPGCVAAHVYTARAGSRIEVVRGRPPAVSIASEVQGKFDPGRRLTLRGSAEPADALYASVNITWSVAMMADDGRCCAALPTRPTVARAHAPRHATHAGGAAVLSPLT
jgi:hypothetical protein